MNIAFEISPLLAASGSFGDKSGVYRYTYGLISAYLDLLKKNKSKEKIILFTFNPNLLIMPQNPGISNLAEHENVIFVNNRKWNQNRNVFYRIFIILFNIEQYGIYDILPLKIIFVILIRVFRMKTICLSLIERMLFKYYCDYLDTIFKKHKVKVISHSDTAFFAMKKYKNVVTVYDLTAINMPSFHRRATRDIQNRKIKFARNYADGILAISDSTKKDLEEQNKRFKKVKSVICYPGVDDFFIKKSATPGSARDMTELFKQRFDIDLSTKKFILYYGTYEPRKNLPHAVRAFSELEKEEKIPSDFIFILCGGKGWGKVKDNIDSFITENYPLTRKRKIITFGFINDEYLKVLIKKAYAVLYPSLYEGFGLPVIESMSQGTPVITTALSSLPEAGGKAAYYIDPYDYTKFKKQLEIILSDPTMRNGMVQKSLEQAAKFKWQKSAKVFADFVKKL